MTFWVAGAAIVGSVITAGAAGDAADSQAEGTAAGIAEQRRQYDLTRSDFAPYRQAGANALGQFAQESNQMPSASDVMSDPGYQFGMQQGQQALDRKASAMGGRVSGAALKSAARFGTNYASTGYGAAYQRRQDRLNRLAALAGIGQTATGASAAAGTAAAENISGLMERGGDNQGSARLARGTVWGNAGNQLSALYGRGGSAGSSTPYRSGDPYSNPLYFSGDEGE